MLSASPRRDIFRQTRNGKQLSRRLKNRWKKTLTSGCTWYTGVRLMNICGTECGMCAEKKSWFSLAS